MDFQVRNLKTKDLYALIAILGKCGKDALSEISAALSKNKEQEEKTDDASEPITEEEIKLKVAEESSKKEKNNMSVGLAVITTLLVYAETDIKPFFASLINKTVSEFDELPMDTTLVIIEELGQKEDLPNFFKRAMSLVSVFSLKK